MLTGYMGTAGTPLQSLLHEHARCPVSPGQHAQVGGWPLSYLIFTACALASLVMLVAVFNWKDDDEMGVKK